MFSQFPKLNAARAAHGLFAGSIGDIAAGPDKLKRTAASYYALRSPAMLNGDRESQESGL